MGFAMSARLQSLYRLAVLLLAVWVAYRWGQQVGSTYACQWIGPYTGCGPWTLWIAGGLIVAIPIIWVGKWLAWIFLKDLEGTTSSLHRRIVGFLWCLPLQLATLALIWFVLAWTWDIFLTGKKTFMSKDTQGYLALWCVLASVFFFYTPVLVRLKATVGKITTPLRHAWRSSKMGAGGSARFAGLLEEWCYRWKKNGIFLGQSIYDPGWQVGLKDDRHALTVAANRAGKGRACIIPNLLIWPHSALVIDPKGTNAIVTAAARGHGGGRVEKGMGQKVFCINPFKVNEGKKGMPPSSRFNPLSIIDLHAPTAYEDIDLLADGLVVPSGGKDTFWDKSAKTLIGAVIGHAVSRYRERATLLLVYRMVAELSSNKSNLIEEMINNPDGRGLIQNAATQIAGAEERLRANIFATAIQHLEWVVSHPMQDALAASDFDFFDLKKAPTTIYLVIPPEYLNTHGRFLRLFVNLAVKAASMGGRSKTPILFLLDEFFSLGPMHALTAASGNIASYNVKLWPIVQNLGQLVEHYPDNWETYVSNTGHVQVFGVNDSTTATYFAARLGRAVVYGTDQQGNRVPAGIADLRDFTEVERETGRRAKARQLVFRAGQDPMILYLQGYDKLFLPKQYNPDPDHDSRGFWKWALARGAVIPLWGWRRMLIGWQAFALIVAELKTLWFKLNDRRRMQIDYKPSEKDRERR